MGGAFSPTNIMFIRGHSDMCVSEWVKLVYRKIIIRSSNIKEVINMNDINLDTIGVSDGTIIIDAKPIND